MKVRKVQSLIYIFKSLLNEGSISKTEIKSVIDMNDLAFRRYMQEIRAFLINFNEPYELIYSRAKDRYYLKSL